MFTGRHARHRHWRERKSKRGKANATASPTVAQDDLLFAALRDRQITVLPLFVGHEEVEHGNREAGFVSGPGRE